MNAIFHPIALVHPSILEFGSGRVTRVGEWIAAQGYDRVLVVADAFNATRINRLAISQKTSLFADVTSEPDRASLDSLLSIARSFHPDVVVGFGGGSAMDLAKLVVVLSGSDQKLSDIVGSEKAEKKRCALVQVPTTAGTGSEVGIRALITDPATMNKLAVESHHMLADLAVVDPDLTFSVPPAITAATGIDALAHCVEAYTSRKAHPVIDLFAKEGIRLIGANLKKAVENGSDREARSAVSLASVYGGFCLGPVNTAAGHALAYPLGSRHHIAHGAANALIFPHVLACNASTVPDHTAFIVNALGITVDVLDENEVRAAAHDFCAGLGIRMKLSAWNVPEDDLPKMATEAHAIRRLLDNNRRDLAEAEILEIYRAAY